MKNGDKVFVRGLFEDEDRIPCTVVGVAARDMINMKPYMYIVKPDEKFEEWDCYTAMSGSIELR